MRFNNYCLGALALVATACTTIYDKNEVLLEQPIDCSTADEDIAALTAATPEPRQRIRAAIGTVMPVGAATGVVTRDYRDRARLATGGFEKDLNNKIADIYEQCGQGA